MDISTNVRDPRSNSTSKRGCWRVDAFPCIPARYVLVVVASFGFIIVFGLRVNLSMAMVVMANSSADANSTLVSCSITHCDCLLDLSIMINTIVDTLFFCKMLL